MASSSRTCCKRFAGDAVGGKLAEQIAGQLVLAGFGSQLDFFQNQFRAELAQFADVLLQVLAFREGFDDFFELGAGVAVALAVEE